MNINKMLISKKSVYIVFVTTLFVLLLPLIAMQFTQEVNWDVGDFIVAGALFVFFGYLYNVLTKASKNTIKNFLTGLLVLVLFIFVWVNLI